MKEHNAHLAERLFDAIERHADRLALVQGDLRWTYADLGAQVHAIRRQIALSGFRPGERALLWQENSPRFVAAWIAVLALRGVAVPLHARTPVAEVSRVLRDVSATGLVVSAFTSSFAAGRVRPDSSLDDERQPTGLAAAVGLDGPPFDRLRFILRPTGMEACDVGSGVDRDVEPASEALAQIVYTSGSTGRPKGVMLSHRNLLANAQGVCASLGLNFDDSIMAVLPFAYSYGNSVLLTHLLAGARIVIENTPYAQTLLERMQCEQVSSLAGVTSTFAMLLRGPMCAPIALPALRTITHAGGPLPAAVFAQMRAAFAQQRIFLMYGQTEASPRLTCLAPEDLDRKPGSVGRAIAGVSLRIAREDGSSAAVDELGEVLAAGEGIMQGYWADPVGSAAALRDGWLHTGDLGRIDGEGYLTLAGRNDEVIKSGGYRVGPAEVEAALLDHPQVRDAAAVGVDDALLGQALWAFVVMDPESNVPEQALLAHCAQHLATYKRPRQIRRIDRLPRTASGKILRQTLRDIAAAAVRTDVAVQK